MDNTKNDNYYLDKIRTDIEFINVHMKDVDLQELNENEVLLDSMLFRMIQISENAKIRNILIFIIRFLTRSSENEALHV